MGSHSRVSRPSTLTRPASGSSRRLISFSTVLLPAPLRPTSATDSPGAIARFRLSRTTREPYEKRTSASETIGSGTGEGRSFRTRPSVLDEGIVRKAVQPSLAGFGRGNYRMAAGARMLAGVAVRRGVAAERRAARLAGAQVHPRRAELDALLALVAGRPLHGAHRH